MEVKINVDKSRIPRIPENFEYKNKFEKYLKDKCNYNELEYYKVNDYFDIKQLFNFTTSYVQPYIRIVHDSSNCLYIIELCDNAFDHFKEIYEHIVLYGFGNHLENMDTNSLIDCLKNNSKDRKIIFEKLDKFKSFDDIKNNIDDFKSLNKMEEEIRRERDEIRKKLMQKLNTIEEK